MPSTLTAPSDIPGARRPADAGLPDDFATATCSRHLLHPRAPGIDEVPGDPHQALAGRKRPAGLLARHTQRPAEQRGYTARDEEIELVARAHLRLPGLLLVPFPLEPLPLPPPLPQLFALHACRVVEGSDMPGR